MKANCKDLIIENDRLKIENKRLRETIEKIFDVIGGNDLLLRKPI